jgi:hypothetical protein
MKNSADCGCGGSTSDLALDIADLANGPDLQELQQALDQLSSEAPDLTLQLAELDGALDETDFDPLLTTEADGPSLASILSLVERYPGLKITFSF